MNKLSTVTWQTLKCQHFFSSLNTDTTQAKNKDLDVLQGCFRAKRSTNRHFVSIPRRHNHGLVWAPVLICLDVYFFWGGGEGGCLFAFFIAVTRS